MLSPRQDLGKSGADRALPVSIIYSSKGLASIENENIARALWLLGKIGGVTD